MLSSGLMSVLFKLRHRLIQSSTEPSGNVLLGDSLFKVTSSILGVSFYKGIKKSNAINSDVFAKNGNILPDTVLLLFRCICLPYMLADTCLLLPPPRCKYNLLGCTYCHSYAYVLRVAHLLLDNQFRGFMTGDDLFLQSLMAYSSLSSSEAHAGMSINILIFHISRQYS